MALAQKARSFSFPGEMKNAGHWQRQFRHLNAQLLEEAWLLMQCRRRLVLQHRLEADKRLVNILLGNDERRRDADDVFARFLAEHALAVRCNASQNFRAPPASGWSSTASIKLCPRTSFTKPLSIARKPSRK